MKTKIYSPCEICERRECMLFKYCSAEWHEELRENKSCMVYSAKQQIVHEGSRVYDILFIQKGKAKVYKKTVEGKNQIVRLSNAGDLLAGEALGEFSQCPVSVITLDESVICSVPQQLYLKLLRSNPELSIHVMFRYADELKKMETRLRNMALMTVREKLADTLLMISEAFGAAEDKSLNASLSRKDIAEIAGTNVDQVSRYLTEFKNDGLIDTKGKAILLLKPEKLHKMIEDYAR